MNAANKEITNAANITSWTKIQEEWIKKTESACNKVKILLQEIKKIDIVLSDSKKATEKTKHPDSGGFLHVRVPLHGSHEEITPLLYDQDFVHAFEQLLLDYRSNLVQHGHFSPKIWPIKALFTEIKGFE